jgi:hypothetical protein
MHEGPKEERLSTSARKSTSGLQRENVSVSLERKVDLKCQEEYLWITKKLKKYP